MKNKTNKNMIIAAIAVSLSASAALVPVLSNIAGAFPEWRDSVQLLITIPPLVIMLVSFVVPKLTKIYSMKLLTVSAYGLLIISGVLPYFIESFEILLISRVLMGIALGVLTPLSSSLPGLYFSDEENIDQATGTQAAFSSFGGILFSYLSGVVAQLFWKDVFLVQFLNVVPLIIILIFMKNERTVNVKEKPASIYIEETKMLNLFAFIMVVASVSFPLNLSLYIEETGLGLSSLGGFIGSMNSFIGFIIGLSFSKIRKTMGNNTLLFALLLISSSLLGMGFIINKSMFLVFSMMFGLGTSLTMPSLMSRIYSKVEKNRVVSAISGLTIMVSVAQFVSPYIINNAALLLGQNVSHRLLLSGFVLLGIMGVFEFYKRKILNEGE